MPPVSSETPHGLGLLKQRFLFAWARGRSFAGRARLFYHTGLKPPLSYRGFLKYKTNRILHFPIKTISGKEFEVFVRDNLYDLETLVEYFSTRRDFLPRDLPLIQPRVIYDIGAHVGFASLFLSAHYPGARLYGFEPLPANHEICSLNYRNLPEARCFPWAVGAVSGNTAFEFEASDLRGGRLADSAPTPVASLGRVTVPTFSIADLITRQGLEPPDILKIDVEGAELDVLKGAADHVRQVKAIFIETHGPALQAACLDWLAAHDFAIRHLHQDARGFASIWCDRR
jgi:FkbM family methyltransferase